MDVEARLVLYVVAVGGLGSLALLVLRRSYELFAHGVILGAIVGVAAAGLLMGEPGAALVAPAGWAYAILGVAPYFAAMAARRLAAARRHAAAWGSMTAAAIALGGPRHLRREAGVYRALALLDRGETERARVVLLRLASLETPRDAERVTDLAHLLPLLADEKWPELLAAVEAAERRSPTVIAMEVQAASESGDLRRALRAARELATRLAPASIPVSQARRTVLAASGRYEFLEEAQRRRLAVADAPRGIFALSLARALEAAGEADRAADVYRRAAPRLRGIPARNAAAGRTRCEKGELRRAHPDEIEAAELHDLEIACLAAPRDPARRPLLERAPATVAVCALTAIVSTLVFVTLGTSEAALAAAGALGHPLVAEEGGWERLLTAMFLHGGFVHLGLNVASALFVGIPYEERMGSVRTLIVYLGSGLVASVCSVFLFRTPLGVGASGAAMGLVGAVGALAWMQPHLFTSHERRTWLTVIGASVVMNGLIGGIEYRHIDNAAHAGGLVAGAALAFVLFPRRGTEAGRGARRILAGSLAAATVIALAKSAIEVPRWLGTKTVRAAGAEAVVPRWLEIREEKPDYVILARPPIPFVVQLGRAGAERPREERLLALLAESDATIDVSWAPAPTRFRNLGDATVEERRVAPPGAEPEDPSLLVLFVTRAGAVAGIAYPDDPAGEAAYGPLAGLIARTLRMNDGRAEGR